MIEQRQLSNEIRDLAYSTPDLYSDADVKKYREVMLPVPAREIIITLLVSAGVDSVSEKDMKVFKTGYYGLYNESPQELVKKLQIHGFDPNKQRDLAFVLRGALASSIIHSQPQTQDFLKAIEQLGSPPLT
ncbi:hypothetical protein HYT02_00570 [Candidatus Gottesmanbacteria bacterium]|nr:hypothetical protein [Candidatus Gottesmanbacteria bacterium]